MKDKRIQEICDKLGFDPKDYRPVLSETEDDREPDPFEKLDDEELDYLIDSGYLGHIK